MRYLSFTLVFIVTLLCGCSSSEESVTYKAQKEISISGKWELSKINNNAITLNEDEEQAYIIFNTQDSTIAVFDGCNNIGGDIIEAEGGNLVLNISTSTLQFCEEQGESEKLGSILYTANKYTITESANGGKILTISDGKNSNSATFIAVKTEEQK